MPSWIVAFILIDSIIPYGRSKNQNQNYFNNILLEQKRIFDIIIFFYLFSIHKLKQFFFFQRNHKIHLRTNVSFSMQEDKKNKFWWQFSRVSTSKSATPTRLIHIAVIEISPTNKNIFIVILMISIADGINELVVEDDIIKKKKERKKKKNCRVDISIVAVNSSRKFKYWDNESLSIE